MPNFLLYLLKKNSYFVLNGNYNIKQVLKLSIFIWHVCLILKVYASVSVGLLLCYYYMLQLTNLVCRTCYLQNSYKNTFCALIALTHIHTYSANLTMDINYLIRHDTKWPVIISHLPQLIHHWTRLYNFMRMWTWL